MSRFILGLICATGLNAEIFIFNDKVDISFDTAQEQFITSQEIGNITFALSRGNNGEIKSLNHDIVPFSTTTIKKTSFKKLPSKASGLIKNNIKPVQIHNKIKGSLNQSPDAAKYLIH